MAVYSFKLGLIDMTIMCLLASTMVAMARPLSYKSTLLARLKLDEEGSSTCWDSLFELQSCSGEVVLFFLNGETYLGKSCCSAIRTIEHHCWPTMLGSLGYTTEEGDILRGYCDASESDDTSRSPPSPPQAVNVTFNSTSHDMAP